MRILKRIAALADRRDLTLIAGVAFLAGGGMLAWEPAGLLLPGAVLTAIAVFGVRELS